MSELRVDNIVSQDGSAAPIYSKGLNIGAGQTLTNNGDYVVGGATSMAGNMSVSGVSTFSGGVTYSSGATVTGNMTINGTLTNNGTFSYSAQNVTGSTTTGSLVVSNDAQVGGALTVTGDLTVNGTTTTIDTAVTSIDSLAVDGVITTGGKPVATTGKAIAMAMVFGG